MRLRVLGPVTVHESTGQPCRLGGRRQEVLLAVLCAEVNRIVPASRLVELLWPEEGPKDPVAALHSQVWRLRSTLSAVGLEVVRRTPGYLLPVERSNLDVLEFEGLVTGTPVDDADPAVLSELLATALAMWRGEPYLGLHDVPALRREAGRLTEMKLSWLERAAARLLATGDVAAATAWLRRAVAEAPLRERSRALLMEALAANGRTAEAVAEFHAYRTLQAEETGLDPGPGIQAAYHRLVSRGGGVAAARPIEPPRPRPGVLTPVPEPLSPIVGREGEADHLLQLLGRGHRLVTLTGPGGVGKTRLAIELAHRKWPGEAIFVDLSTVTEPEDVPEAFARAHGVSLASDDPVIDVAAGLGDQELMLLVDNFEQVLPAAEFLLSLLSRCPRLAAVVTSREALAVPGEMEYPVQPLAVPAPVAGPDDVFASAAAALFLERLSVPLAVVEDDARGVAAHIGQLCRELGGLPLAIELAAALARTRSIDEVFARVVRSLQEPPSSDGPAGPLAAALQWSYERLQPAEQRALRRLCVFRGHFERAAAAAVCAVDDAELEAALDRLVALGLLHLHREATGVRYSVPGILTAYLRQRWPDPAERANAETAHFHYHARQCRAPRFLDDELLTRLDAGYPDFLDALKHGLARVDCDDEVHDVAIAMVLYWLWREQPQIALRWLDRLAARFPDSPTRLARADVLRAGFLRNLGRIEEAAGLAARSTTALESAGDPEWLLTSYAVRAAIADSRGDADELVRCAESGVRAARAGVPRRLAEALGYLAYAYAAADDPARASQTGREALALLDDIDSLALRAGTRINAAQALIEAGHGVVALEVLTSGCRELRGAPEGMPNYWLPLGWAHLATGDDSGALRWFRKFIDHMVQTDQWPPAAEAIAGCACSLVQSGHVRVAALALGGAERLMERFDVRVSPWIRRRLDSTYATIVHEPHGRELMHAGAQLTADAVVHLVSARAPSTPGV